MLDHEIDFIGAPEKECKDNADAICFRIKENDTYRIYVYDGGFSCHGKRLVDHLNNYYFDDPYNKLPKECKIIDAVIVSHSDRDHTSGLTEVLENFTVCALFMNIPWKCAEIITHYECDGRKTVNSVTNELKKKYKIIADLELLANENNIPIYEAFQGITIDSHLRILSPSKSFYLKMICDSRDNELPSVINCADHSLEALLESEHDMSTIETWEKETLDEDPDLSPSNKTSVVLFGHMYDCKNFLLVGDADSEALFNAIEYFETKVKPGKKIRNFLSFIQIPHHGGRHNVCPDLLNHFIGPKVIKGVKRNIIAVASTGENTGYPRRVVSNAFKRRGVTVYSNQGKTLNYKQGDIPDRDWNVSPELPFYKFVENKKD